ncbi:hypothetical protein POG22_17415 [Geitlerinema sp. CS-897]|nr:hypothetical protein [Geitlerinema sp. CS-897]
MTAKVVFECDVFSTSREPFEKHRNTKTAQHSKFSFYRGVFGQGKADIASSKTNREHRKVIARTPQKLARTEKPLLEIRIPYYAIQCQPR